MHMKNLIYSILKFQDKTINMQNYMMIIIFQLQHFDKSNHSIKEYYFYSFILMIYCIFFCLYNLLVVKSKKHKQTKFIYKTEISLQIFLFCHCDSKEKHIFGNHHKQSPFLIDNASDLLCTMLHTKVLLYECS